MRSLLAASSMCIVLATCNSSQSGPGGIPGGTAGGGAVAGSGGTGATSPTPPPGGSGGAPTPPTAPTTGGAAVEPDAAVVVMADAAPAAPTPVGGLPGLTKLFDGMTLNGWMGNPMIWTVKDGAIDGNTQKGGQLIVTAVDYDDFRMIVATKLVSGKNHLGVCFWGGRGGFSYNGCKLVIPPDGGSWDYGGSGGLKGAKEHQTPFTNTDWHTSEILAHLSAGTIAMATDGKRVLDWKAPNAGVLKKGPIGLQIHAGASEVQYKDISIEVAPKEDRLITLTP